MTSNHHALYDPGLTRTTMAFNKEKQSREAEQISKKRLSSDCRLQLACMKSELLVIADQHAPYDLGYTRNTMAHTKGSNTARWSKSHKLRLSSD